jgi:hypothetical protein
MVAMGSQKLDQKLAQNEKKKTGNIQPIARK